MQSSSKETIRRRHTFESYYLLTHEKASKSTPDNNLFRFLTKKLPQCIKNGGQKTIQTSEAPEWNDWSEHFDYRALIASNSKLQLNFSENFYV
jgi:hypothetical protein